jgi:hypothetical protein
MLSPRRYDLYEKALRKKKIVLKKSNPMELTKCYNTDCPKKETCYRFTMPTKEWQLHHPFEVDQSGKCDHYFEITPAKPEEQQPL